MKRSFPCTARTCVAVSVVLLCMLASRASAQTSGEFDLSWNAITSGGGAPTGPSFQLTCAIGQPATETLNGGIFSLTGGFIPQLPLPPACLADLDDGSRQGIPDQAVTIDDLIFFLILFEDGDVRADLDDGSRTGVPDGGVTIDDLVYFLYRFELGC